MSIFNWKSKKEDSMPTIPDLPEELKVPTSNLAEPPRPSYADQTSSTSLPPMPNLDLPNMDSMNAVPAKGTNFSPPMPGQNTMAQTSSQSYAPQQSKVSPNVADLEKDAKSLNNFDFEDFSLGDLDIETPAPKTKQNIPTTMDSSEDLPKATETKSSRSTYSEVEVASKSTGPIFVKVENFKKMIDVIGIAKDEVDGCVENGNLLLNDNNTLMKQSMDNLQVNMQQMKSKIYRAEHLLFE